MPLPQGYPPTQHPGAAQAEALQGPERLADPTPPDADRTGSFRTGLRTKIAVATGALLSSFAIIAPGGSIAEDNPRAVSSLPVPTAQESAKRGRGMQPAGVIRAISGVLARAHNSSGYGVPNTRLAKLTPTSSLLQGRCKPKDGWLSKRIATRQGKSFNTYCNGKNNGGIKLISPTEYSNGLNWLGNRVATSAGVPAESRGSTTKATANPRRAVIRFANDDAQAEARQLSALILKKGKKPTKRWYPAQ
ncbi:MAG TPA: hypothetical protein VFX79_02225 [Candidatus Saccharimonadales bacterium]|nr:hypothetical protein [Candidatus Saccharimonadales bacterium]